MKSLFSIFLLAIAASAVTPTPMTGVAKSAVTHSPSRHNPSDAVRSIIYPRDAPTAAEAPDPVRQLLYIAPKSNTCDDAPQPGECVTSNPTTVKALIDSFAKYGVTTAAEQAALLSWMAYESAEFKYNRNHFPAPGNPGQGTRCMISPDFVKAYASSIPELQDVVKAAGGDLDKVLALVQPDQYSFAAAAWYYSAHCSDAQKKAIAAGGQGAWEKNFVTGCVSTTMDENRTLYWKRACEALGVTVTA